MRRRVNLFGLWLAAVAAACALSAPLAQAGWLPPVDISAPSESAGSPHVVLDSEGNATAVWQSWNGTDTVVESAYRPAGEGWGAPVDLSSEPDPGGEAVPGAHNAGSPRIVVDRNGNVTVIWDRYAGSKILLQTVNRPTGGSWTAPVDVAEVNLGMDPEPWIAVDWEGNSTAVWKQDEVIQSSFRPFAGDWGAPVPLSGEESLVPQAAMDARGDATAVWMHHDGSHYVVESSYRPEQGEWESPTLVSQPGEDGGNPHVALDAKGDSLVVWRGEDEGEEFLRAAYRPVGGSWSQPTNVSAPGEQVQQPRAALDPDGNAIVAWAGNTGELGGHDIARAAFKPVGGDWGSPTDLSTDGGNAFPSDVVFDTSGNAAVVWGRWDGSSNLVQAAYRPVDAGWEPAVDLSEAGKQGMDAVVVLDAPGDANAADGHATAVWISEESVDCTAGEKEPCSSDTVQAAGYDPDGIPAVEIEAPAEAVVGEPVEISTPTEGLFSPLIEFGDGTSAADTQASHAYDAPGEYEVTVGGAELLGYRATTRRTIAIAPAGPPSEPQEEPDPKPTPGPAAPGPAAAKENTPAEPSAEPTPSAAPSPGCVQAEIARDRALRRLKLASAKSSRADGPAEARLLNAEKRRQAAALHQARRHLAACN
jgi:hypothetical protein